jgi:spermidine synthase
MSAMFEELDWQPTEIGPISLRRRRDPALGGEVWEIKLGDAFLMSSRFTASEEALARLALARLKGAGLSVAVGGLGLGHTVAAALEDGRVAGLLAVEFLAPVIEWHREGLLPLGPALCADARVRLAQGDFFALAASEAGLDPEAPGRRFDAILLDIDHAPGALLDARSESFYTPEGLAGIARHLTPGGIFALWSNEPPEPAFAARMAAVFADAAAEPVSFHNPLQDRPFTQTVYLGRRPG